MLQVHRNSMAVIVSMENISQNWYMGKRKDMMIQNAIFRVGGAAVLLSNRRSDRKRARYMLQHTVKSSSLFYKF